MAFALKQLGATRSLIRAFHTTPTANISKDLDKFMFNMNHFRKYGLLEDDLQRDIFPEVKEAISRLPENLRMERMFRSVRAQQLYLSHNILPEEEWTTYENPNHHYLQPYLEEIRAEIKEREDWEKNH